MSTVTIGGLTAAPGEKVKGFLDAGTTSVNTYRVPLAIINGSRKGKTIGIIGGTHSTEFASIDAVIRAIMECARRDHKPNGERGRCAGRRHGPVQ